MANQEDIRRIYQILKQQGDDIAEIKQVLRGNSEFEQDGYMQRIASNETSIKDNHEAISNVQKRIDHIYNRVIGIGIGIAAVISVLLWLIETYFKAGG
nr:hypothetical protein 10 [Balneolaceae bacterium]